MLPLAGTWQAEPMYTREPFLRGSPPKGCPLQKQHRCVQRCERVILGSTTSNASVTTKWFHYASRGSRIPTRSRPYTAAPGCLSSARITESCAVRPHRERHYRRLLVVANRVAPTSPVNMECYHPRDTTTAHYWHIPSLSDSYCFLTSVQFLDKTLQRALT